MELICKCGAIIPDENFEYFNGCNDEGEDFSHFQANCDNCKAEYETSNWGECDSPEDAKDILNEYIKSCE